MGSWANEKTEDSPQKYLCTYKKAMKEHELNQSRIWDFRKGSLAAYWMHFPFHEF